MFDHRPIYCHTVLNSSHKCAPIQQWCLQRCGGQWSLTVVMCPFHSTPHCHTNGNMSLTILHWHWEITAEAVNTTAGLNSSLVLHYARWHGVSVLCWALGLVYGHSRLSQEFSKIRERAQDADVGFLQWWVSSNVTDSWTSTWQVKPGFFDPWAKDATFAAYDRSHTWRQHIFSPSIASYSII